MLPLFFVAGLDFACMAGFYMLSTLESTSEQERIVGTDDFSACGI